MSGRIVGEILDNAPEDLTQLELCILVAIGEEAREKDRIALYNTSADAIAYRVRSTPSTVRNVLARLKERGLLIPLHNKVHRGHAQQYEIPKMGPHHRRATWTARPTSAATRGTGEHQSPTEPTTATSTGPADATHAEQPIQKHAESNAPRNGKRNSAVTQSPHERATTR